MKTISILRFLAVTFFFASSTMCLANSSGLHAPWIGDSFNGGPCKARGQGYGPYDYLKRYQLTKNLALVEGAHFTKEVEQLTAGKSTLHPAPDLHYTLMAWPNHHRALYTAITYQLREKNKFHRSFNLAECYLQRAVNFSPKDSTSYMLYGLLLHRSNRLNEALEKYRIAEEITPAHANLRYNIGLLLVDLKKYEEAQQYANSLYKRKYPLPGLKNKLEKAGYPVEVSVEKTD